MFGALGHSNFEFVSDFEFRASSFGFVSSFAFWISDFEFPFRGVVAVGRVGNTGASGSTPQFHWHGTDL